MTLDDFVFYGWMWMVVWIGFILFYISFVGVS